MSEDKIEVSDKPALDRCPICRYSLLGLPTVHRCPECGFEYDEETVVVSEPANWLLAFIGTIVFSGFTLSRIVEIALPVKVDGWYWANVASSIFLIPFIFLTIQYVRYPPIVIVTSTGVLLRRVEFLRFRTRMRVFYWDEISDVQMSDSIMKGPECYIHHRAGVQSLRHYLQDGKLKEVCWRAATARLNARKSTINGTDV